MDKNIKSNRRRPPWKRAAPGTAKSITLAQGFGDDRPTLDQFRKAEKKAAYVKYSPQMADQIAALIAEGYTMTELSRVRGFPSLGTMVRWLGEYDYFLERFRHAREISMHALAEKILTIADEARADNVEVAKLRIDVRKFLMARYNPKVFSDRLQDGGQGGRFVITWQGEGEAEKPKLLDVTPQKAD